MEPRMFSGDEKAKIKKLFAEGIQVMSEVNALNEGLSETIKAIAEELDMKPGVLKKALRIAYKNEFFFYNSDDKKCRVIHFGNSFKQIQKKNGIFLIFQKTLI